MRVPLKLSGTLGPSSPEGNSPPDSSFRLLMPPPVGFSPHTPYPSIAGEALSLNEETNPRAEVVVFLFPLLRVVSCY